MDPKAAQVRIDGDSSWDLLDNSSIINAVTPEFIEAHSLDVSLLSNLVDSTMGIYGFGGLFSQPLGYIIIRIQVERVWGYDEDQVALVVSIQLPLDPECWLLWAHWPSIKS